jgi:outer membrane protein assembly factor BamB
VRRPSALRLLFAACVAALAAASPATALGPTRDPTSWTSYGYDNQLTNAVALSALTPITAPRLTLSWSHELDGPILASPLSARVNGTQLVFVSTEAGTVYALSATTGEIVWQRSLGTVQTLECGSWGITSSGAIDLARGLLFEIGAQGQLHALELASGEEATGYPVVVVTNNQYEYVWGGLRIAGDRIYVPVASYCDAGPPGGPMPEGRLVAVPVDHPQDAAVWDPVPGAGNMGGMWGWGGVSVDPDNGRVFTGVGNSYAWSEECSCYVDNAGYGDRIVALSPDLTTTLDSNDPGIPATGDSDFGAAPLLFHPPACPPLAAMNNKDGTLYIWNRDHLTDGPIVRIPLGDGIAAFVGSPSWSESKQMLYVGQSVVPREGAKVGNGVTAWHVDPGCGFRPIWEAATGDGNQATPLVVGDVLLATGGKSGGFFALQAGTGARLWSYPTDGRTVSAMIAAGGQVFGADTAGFVYAFSPPRRPGGFRARTVEV